MKTQGLTATGVGRQPHMKKTRSIVPLNSKLEKSLIKVDGREVNHTKKAPRDKFCHPIVPGETWTF